MTQYIENLRRQLSSMSSEELDAYTRQALESERAMEALQRDIDAAEEPERWDGCE